MRRVKNNLLPLNLRSVTCRAGAVNTAQHYTMLYFPSAVILWFYWHAPSYVFFSGNFLKGIRASHRYKLSCSLCNGFSCRLFVMPCCDLYLQDHVTSPGTTNRFLIFRGRCCFFVTAVAEIIVAIAISSATVQLYFIFRIIYNDSISNG